MVFKSTHFPTECVATRRGSPLLVGVKSDKPITVDQVPVLCTQSGSRSGKVTPGTYLNSFYTDMHVSYLYGETHGKDIDLPYLPVFFLQKKWFRICREIEETLRSFWKLRRRLENCSAHSMAC